MIKRLSISQFVIITELVIDFSSGLTVLTGETGAGKSILLDAMGLILGEDAEPESIRQGHDEAKLEGVFAPEPDHPVWAFLARHGVDTANEFTIHRVIGRKGKDEILVNGKVVGLPVLKELGTYLVEIHGQFANQNFLAPENQLSLLDAFGAYPEHILGNVAAAWNEIIRITKAADEERSFLATYERDKPAIEKLVKAVDRITLQQGQYQEFVKELDYLTTMRDLCEMFQNMNAQLIAQSGVELSLIRVERSLNTQPDPELDTIKLAIKEALVQTRLAIMEMQKLAPKYLDVDTSGIKGLQDKLAAIREIATEQKVPPEGLFAHYEFLLARLNRIRRAPAKIKELDGELIRANETYRKHAAILSDERRKAAVLLGKTITLEMPPLKLQAAQVEVEVSENTYERTIRGYNTVCFNARMNHGMPFSPIAKTASGGELARLILALKMILQSVQIVSTLVFDEIDTGIGGAAAAAVGSRIARLSDHAQILVITHSPQVASRGSQHLRVSKSNDGNTTQTVVRMLTVDERIDEISRMLAGEELTAASAAAARSLMDEAERNAAARKAEPQPPPPPLMVVAIPQAEHHVAVLPPEESALADA